MMKRTMIYGLGVLLTVAMSPALGEEVDRTIDAASDGHIRVSNTSGSVTVSGWSRSAVEVTGELGRNVEELILERDGDRVTVKVKVPRKGGRGIESDLHIQVPAGSSINVGTVSADIEVMKVRGDQTLESVSGDIDTETEDADISAEVVSGDIEVRGKGRDAETRAGAVSGDLTLVGVAGVLEGGTVTGDMVVDGGSFDRAKMHTVNGEILFNSELRKGGKLSAEAVNGTIDLKFAGEVSARFEFDTLNGDIETCFGPEPKRTSKYTPGWILNFQEGNGDGTVSASTVNGDIIVCR